MREIINNGSNRLLVFDKGEEVIEPLGSYCYQNDIKGASFTAIGAVGSVVLSYYRIRQKRYLDKTFEEDLEIASVIGNVGRREGYAGAIHAHGLFSREDYSVIGGHIKKMVVSATCEVALTCYTERIERELDDDTGLYLIQSPKPKTTGSLS